MKDMIAGAGVAALEALIALRGLAEDRVSIELVLRTEIRLPAAGVAEPFAVGEARGYDSCASPRTTAPHSIWPGSTRWSHGAAIHMAGIDSVEPENQRVHTGMAARCRMTCR
jgi:hypothetical protein